VIIKYEIRKGQHAPCELWSIVPTNFGGDAENFVCHGTREYCNSILDHLREIAKRENQE